MTPAEQQAFFGCAEPFNSLPFHFVAETAIHALGVWATGGSPPPSAPPITTVEGKIQRDADGNALGGLRTPGLQVPTATYGPIGHGSGKKLLSPAVCLLFGTTTPFTAGQLAARYPTHAAYVADVTKAVKADLAAGYLLAPDARQIISDAKKSMIGD
jgi:hypothetical protein